MASVVMTGADETFLDLIQEDLGAVGHDINWVRLLGLLDTEFPIDAFVSNLCLSAGTPNGHAPAQLARARRPRVKIVHDDASDDTAGFDELLAAPVVRARKLKDVADAVEQALTIDPRTSQPPTVQRPSPCEHHP